MCLGIPMQVESMGAFDSVARCRTSDGSSARDVNVLLLDQAPSVGDWLLVHIDTAVRAIEADEARTVADALAALAAADRGRPFEHLIADLVDRTPELPAHLRSQAEPADS